MAETDPLNLNADDLLKAIKTLDKQIQAGDLPKSRVQGKSGGDSWKWSYIHKILTAYAKRIKEGWRLYTPLPAAEEFHSCTAARRVLDGSNRAGKTVTAAMEVVRLATGNDPHHKRSGPQRILVVGRDLDHIGQVMWRKMSWPGAFQVIKDEETGVWRTLRPDPDDPTKLCQSDLDRRSEWRPAPPLLPARLIQKIAWEDAGRGIPRLVTLKNGTEIMFRSGGSGSQPPRGVDLDVIWFDEEIENSEWYYECLARLIDRSGVFIWSATPQSATEELISLRESANAGDLYTRAYQLLIDDNPYLPPDQKQQFFESLSDDERNVRYYGHYAYAGRRVYPEYQPLTHHGCRPFDIPPTWTRYVVLDPGVQVAAVLLAAVPPEGYEIYIYREIVLKHTDTLEVARRVKEGLGGIKPEALVIDYRYGRQKTVDGQTNASKYAEAFKTAKVFARRKRNKFFWGNDNVEYRTEVLKDYMRIDEEKGDRARLQIFHGACPILDQNLRAATFDKDKANKRTNRKLHCLDCLEYLVAFHPYYHLPDSSAHDDVDKTSYDAFQKKTKAKSKMQQWRGMLGNTMSRFGHREAS